MKEAVSIGLVGCGEWGKNILRDLCMLGCEVFVVCRSAVSWKRAGDGGAASIVKYLSDLPPVQGVVVATPTSTHFDVTQELLDRKVPIFVEKPITNSTEQAKALMKAAPKLIFVMDKWRYHPGVEALRDIVRSEELGPVQGLHTVRVGWGNPHADVDTVWILAPHDLAIALEILGKQLPAMSAVADTIGNYPVLLYGILGSQPWHILEVSSRRRERCREVRVHFRDGIATLQDGYSDHILITRTQDPMDTKIPVPEIRKISTEFPLLRELRTFVEHVKGGPSPRSSLQEAIEIVKTIESLRQLANIS